MKKSEALKEWAKVLERPNVEKWYDTTLKGKLQAETIDSLKIGVISEQLSLYEALCIALIIGVQWNEKFEEEK